MGKRKKKEFRSKNFNENDIKAIYISVCLDNISGYLHENRSICIHTCTYIHTFVLVDRDHSFIYIYTYMCVYIMLYIIYKCCNFHNVIVVHRMYLT